MIAIHDLNRVIAWERLSMCETLSVGSSLSSGAVR